MAVTGLIAGANLPLTGGPAVTDVVTSTAIDVSAILLTSTRRARGDSDLVFFSHPAQDGVRLDGSRLSIDFSRVPSDVAAVVLAASIEATTSGVTFDPASTPSVQIADGDHLLRFAPAPLTRGETVVLLVEFYRRGDQWKVRALGHGYDTGLAGFAADFGLDVEPRPGAATTAVPPTRPAPLPPSFPLLAMPAPRLSTPAPPPLPTSGPALTARPAPEPAPWAPVPPPLPAASGMPPGSVTQGPPWSPVPPPCTTDGPSMAPAPAGTPPWSPVPPPAFGGPAPAPADAAGGWVRVPPPLPPTVVAAPAAHPDARAHGATRRDGGVSGPPGPGAVPVPAPEGEGPPRKRKRRRFRVIGAVALVIVIAVVSIVVTMRGESKAKTLVSTYLTDIQQGRYQDAYNLLCPSKAKQTNLASFSAEMKRRDNTLGRITAVSGYDYTASQSHGTTHHRTRTPARMTVKITRRATTTVTYTIGMDGTKSCLRDI